MRSDLSLSGVLGHAPRFCRPARLDCPITSVKCLLTLALRSLRSPAHRHQIAPVLAGFGLAGAAFLVLWMAALLHPDLQVYRLSLPDTLFVFVPYLMPWLLLPLSLVAASRLGQEDRSRLLETAPESDRSWTGDASVARLSTKQWEAKAERRDAHL